MTVPIIQLDFGRKAAQLVVTLPLFLQTFLSFSLNYCTSFFYNYSTFSISLLHKSFQLVQNSLACFVWPSRQYPVSGTTDTFAHITAYQWSLNNNVGNELVHVVSHTRPLVVDRGMPSQGGNTGWWYLYLIKYREPTVGYRRWLATGATQLLIIFDISSPSSKTPKHTNISKILHICVYVFCAAVYILNCVKN